MKIILTIMLLFISVNALAEIYKWVDEDGKVHFSDSIPADQTPEEMNLKVNSYSDVSYETASTNSNTVVMYSTSWCGYCKKAKKYFTENNIKFVEYDIEESLSAKLSYDKLGGRGVPVILYQGQRMNGFSESGFNRIYQN